MFVALAFVGSLLTHQSSTKVTVVSIEKSSFNLVGWDDGMPLQQSVIKSHSGENPGWVVVKRKDDPDSDITIATEELKTARIAAIATRAKGDRFTVWDVNGKSLPLTEEVFRKDHRNLLKVGGIAVKLQCPFDKKKNVFRVMDCGIHNQNFTNDNGMDTTWIYLEHPSSPMVDIAISLRGKRTVGSISSKIGSRSSFGEVSVSVEEFSNAAPDLRDRVRKVVVVSPISKIQFQVEPELDSKIPKQQRLMDSMNVISSMMNHEETVDEAKKTRTSTFSVSSRFPVTSWPTMSVTANSTLFGYFSHVPMKPLVSRGERIHS